jgi:hypothetical protein
MFEQSGAFWQAYISYLAEKRTIGLSGSGVSLGPVIASAMFFALTRRDRDMRRSYGVRKILPV